MAVQMADNPIQAKDQLNEDSQLVSAYKIMLSIVADWEQNEYSESINGNFGCLTEERQLTALADPKSDTVTQQG